MTIKILYPLHQTNNVHVISLLNPPLISQMSGRGVGEEGVALITDRCI